MSCRCRPLSDVACRRFGCVPRDGSELAAATPTCVPRRRKTRRGKSESDPSELAIPKSRLPARCRRFNGSTFIRLPFRLSSTELGVHVTFLSVRPHTPGTGGTVTVSCDFKFEHGVLSSARSPVSAFSHRPQSAFSPLRGPSGLTHYSRVDISAESSVSTGRVLTKVSVSSCPHERSTQRPPAPFWRVVGHLQLRPTGNCALPSTA